MDALVLHSSPTEDWLSLLAEAQSAVDCKLDDELESYLVFLLMRFTRKSTLASRVLAIEYLASMHVSGHSRRDLLRDIGDSCLLYAGLFPQRAQRRRVKISYFIDLGRSAYRQLSDCLDHGAAAMYGHLSGGFISLVDVLLAVRELGEPQSRLEPLHALELWNDTGSRQALRSLRAVTAGLPMADPGKQ